MNNYQKTHGHLFGKLQVIPERQFGYDKNAGLVFESDDNPELVKRVRNFIYSSLDKKLQWFLQCDADNCIFFECWHKDDDLLLKEAE